MRSHVRLGSVSGVPVEANASLLAAVGLFAYLLATRILPASVKASTTAYWVVAVIVSLLFIAAVAAHEVAHALVARRCGIPVKRITLWMLGGVTEFERNPSTPREQLAVSAAGPLTSLGLGGIFLLLGYLTSLLHAPHLVVAGLVWLGGTNLLLGVFNLLPGVPLDGGRVLQSLLWKRWGDRARAEVGAAKAGRVLAVVFIGVGAAMATSTTGWFDGLWLMLVGWFIWSASTAELQSAGLTDAMAGLKVRDVMSPDPVTLPAYLTVQEVSDRVTSTRAKLFPVVDVHGNVSGTIDIDTLVRLPEWKRHNVHVGDLVRQDGKPATAAPDELVRDVVRRGNGSRAPILVFENSRLVGTLSEEDITWGARHAALRSGGADRSLTG